MNRASMSKYDVISHALEQFDWDTTASINYSYRQRFFFVFWEKTGRTNFQNQSNPHPDTCHSRVCELFILLDMKSWQFELIGLVEEVLYRENE
jgi:hypothetical protein